nr:MAG TPA: hypothetical protein [Caudoviricetes sp.]
MLPKIQRLADTPARCFLQFRRLLLPPPLYGTLEALAGLFLCVVSIHTPLSIGAFCGFLAVIEPHKISKVHCYAPRFPASAVKYGGQTVLEMPAVPFGLLHPLGKPDLFAAFAFDMDSRQSRKIWNLAK